jgi:hypothetical protein
MPKIEISIEILSVLYPEAKNISFLPRKKKKKMKIKIAKKLMDLATEYAKTLTQ